MLGWTRFTLAMLVVAGLSPLAACDSAGEEQPPLCEAATLVERADTMFVAVGGSGALDLEVLFAGTADEPLTFALIVAQSHVVLHNGSAIVTPVVEGVTSFEVRASTDCGVVAEAVVTVSALPPGTTCPAPTAAPAGYLRVPSGGAIITRRLWGPDGVIEGLFHFNAPAAVEGGDGLVQASVVYALGGRSLQIVPGTQEGQSTLTITATDACLRTVVVDIPIEVVYAPDCVFIEPGYADFLPLEVGRTWIYRYERGADVGIGGGNNWHEAGNETWEVSGSTACAEGYREYTVTVTRAPDNGTPVALTLVLGSEGGVILPRVGIDPGTWPSITRYNPYDPELLTFTRGVGGSSGYAIVTVQREVGIASTNVQQRGSGGSRSYYERVLVTP